MVAAATGLSCLGALAGASAAQAQCYPPGGGPFVVSTTLVIAGGKLTFTATLPCGQPIVVELSLPPLPPLPAHPHSGSVDVVPKGRQDVKAPQALATLVPDAHGHVSGSVTIPQGTAPGQHTLTLVTTKDHHVLVTAPLRVEAGTVAPMRLQQDPSRHFTRPLLAAGAMTVGTGLGGWALRRRRPRHDED